MKSVGIEQYAAPYLTDDDARIASAQSLDDRTGAKARIGREVQA